MIAVIGSVALRHWVPVDRYTIDIDVVASYDDCLLFADNYFSRIVETYPFKNGDKLVFKGFKHNNQKAVMECEIAWEDSHTANFLQAIVNDPQSVHTVISNVQVVFPSLDFLYMIKMSHRYLKNNKHFNKTMSDIKLLRSVGAKLQEAHLDMYKERQSATYVYDHPNLNVEKDQFFDKSESFYVYDHDTIHLSIMHLDKPAYEYFKPEDNQVYCDKQLFDSSPYSIQLLAVLEECYVLAAERSQLQYGATVSRKRSFDMALEKVCTSITSGFFREFAYEHYWQVQALYEDNYMDRVLDGINTGIVVPLAA